jgi:hypothetical protein
MGMAPDALSTNTATVATNRVSQRRSIAAGCRPSGSGTPRAATDGSPAVFLPAGGTPLCECFEIHTVKQRPARTGPDRTALAGAECGGRRGRHRPSFGVREWRCRRPSIADGRCAGAQQDQPVARPSRDLIARDGARSAGAPQQRGRRCELRLGLMSCRHEGWHRAHLGACAHGHVAVARVDEAIHSP